METNFWKNITKCTTDRDSDFGSQGKIKFSLILKIKVCHFIFLFFPTIS